MMIDSNQLLRLLSTIRGVATQQQMPHGDARLEAVQLLACGSTQAQAAVVLVVDVLLSLTVEPGGGE